MELYSVKLSDKGTVAVDDTILVKGVVTSAGSHILEGFKPLFSAEAVSRLENAGYEIAGKTHVGEFGLDLVGEFSYYGEKDEDLKGAAATLVACRIPAWRGQGTSSFRQTAYPASSRFFQEPLPSNRPRGK